ncbi:MAG: hypothetical protein AAGN82_08905 [Myxococcota bacterium]
MALAWLLSVLGPLGCALEQDSDDGVIELAAPADASLPPVDGSAPTSRPPPSDGCDDGEVRLCEVYIDERNCFEGAQSCRSGVWGPCLEPDDITEPEGEDDEGDTDHDASPPGDDEDAQ